MRVEQCSGVGGANALVWVGGASLVWVEQVLLTCQDDVLHVNCKTICFVVLLYVSGIWQGRDESGNPMQKHDVELIKDKKR